MPADHRRVAVGHDTSPGQALLPVAIGQLRLGEGSLGLSGWSYVRLQPARGPKAACWRTCGSSTIRGDWSPPIKGLRLQAADRRALLGRARWQEWLYEVAWRPEGGQAAVRAWGDYRSVAEEVSRQLESLSQAAGLPHYGALLAELEELSLEIVWQTLEQLAAFPPRESGERLEGWRLEGWRLEQGVVPSQRRLLHRMLQMLQEADLLVAVEGEAGCWQVARPRATRRWSLGWSVCAREYAEGTAELELLRRTPPNLSAVLVGQQALFGPVSRGSTRSGTHLYVDSPGPQALNRVAAAVLAGLQQRLPLGSSLRVLEIGAGTGGTTAELLPQLTQQDCGSTGSPISPRVLPPRPRNGSQSIPACGTPCWISSNPPPTKESPKGPSWRGCQRAARHGRPASDARPCPTSLSPGGLLILLEGTSPQRWVDLTFGLTEGWWRFSDQELRPDHPLLSCDRWSQLLQQCGFETPCSLRPLLGEAAESMGAEEAVLLARKPILAAPAAGPLTSGPLTSGSSLKTATGHSMLGVRARRRVAASPGTAAGGGGPSLAGLWGPAGTGRPP